jgi:hypothetical protein
MLVDLRRVKNTMHTGLIRALFLHGVFHCQNETLNVVKRLSADAEISRHTSQFSGAKYQMIKIMGF